MESNLEGTLGENLSAEVDAPLHDLALGDVGGDLEDLDGDGRALVGALDDQAETSLAELLASVELLDVASRALETGDGDVRAQIIEWDVLDIAG